MTKHLVLDDLDMAAICGQLSATGVTSFRILDGNFRESLLHEATCYRYKPEEEIVGSTPHRDRLRYVNLVCVFNGSMFVPTDPDRMPGK